MHARTHARQVYDFFRESHDMQLRGSSKSAYGTVAAANAAAKSQFDKFRRNELSKKSAMDAEQDDTENREVFTHSEDADTDADQEFTEFTESTDADGAASWSWEFTWWEDDATGNYEKGDGCEHLVAHKGNVRVVRTRVLAEDDGWPS
jgi:hypothetical protein